MFLLWAILLAADISGSYSGTVTTPTPDGERKRPTLVIVKQTPGKIEVSIGSNPTEQHPASNVKLEGDKLTFDVIPPGAERPVATFDVRTEPDKLTGTVVMTLRGGEQRTGQVDLKKQ